MGEPIKVHDANNGAEAELIREALAEHEIDATIDMIAGPLDGLTAMGQGTPIFVDSDHAAKAREVIDNIHPARLEEAREQGE